MGKGANQQMANDPQYAYLRGHLARHIWEQFKFTVLYVDDLQSICNPMLNDLLYEDMSVAGGLITGIYPRACPWEDCAISDITRVLLWTFCKCLSRLLGIWLVLHISMINEGNGYSITLILFSTRIPHRHYLSSVRAIF